MPKTETSSDWRRLCRKAFLEIESEKLAIRIDIANQAIRFRLWELWQLGLSVVRERSELDTAAHLLGLLRMISLKSCFSKRSAHSSFAPGKHPSQAHQQMRSWLGVTLGLLGRIANMAITRGGSEQCVPLIP
jgi:hypothetical protein